MNTLQNINMMDHHSEQLLDIMDAHNSMSFHMDGNITSSSPLLTSVHSGTYVPYSFTLADGQDGSLSPQSPLTDHSSSDNDIPLSPQNDHPFSEALGDTHALFFPPTIVASTTAAIVPANISPPNTNVSSSSSSLPLSLSSRQVPFAVPSVTPTPSAVTSSSDGKSRNGKRKAATSVASTSNKSSSRVKGRRTDTKKEAASASKSNSSSTTKKMASITPTPTPTSKPSTIRTTRSGARAASSTSATSPLVPTRGGCDEDKTAEDSTIMSLPLLEAIPSIGDATTANAAATSAGVLATPPPHMVAAMGNLAVMGAVTLAQPEYERMLAEEERTKEKKLRKAEQARISRQKKKDRMTLLEESVAMYKQQIAHLQSLPAATAAAVAVVATPATPVPTTTAERKASISPVWGNSNANDDTRSVQSGDDSSSSQSSGSSTAPSPSLSSRDIPVKDAADLPASAPIMTTSSSTSSISSDDEVSGEAIQRCIQTIITSSYPAASPSASPNGSSVSGYGLMQTGAVHAGIEHKEGSQTASAAETLNNNIQSLFDMFNKRARVTESHLESLDKLLVPSMPLRFLEWSLTQNDKFYSDPNGLWHCLWSKTLSLTNEQMSSLQALRSEVIAQRQAEAEIRMQALSMTGIVVNPTPTTTTTSVDGTAATSTTTTAFPVASVSSRSMSLSSTLSLQAAYSQLSALSRLHLSASNRWLRTLATILTPLQVARYFEWVNIYGHICVQINI